eukprot:scaffold118705_cov45-Phaeocystis_antarctica.AAC.1
MPKHSLGQASLAKHAPGCAVAHAAIVTHRCHGGARVVLCCLGAEVSAVGMIDLLLLNTGKP